MKRQFDVVQLVVATHNQGKLDEVTQLLAPYPVEILSAKALDLREPAETEPTFIGNARIKAHFAAKASGLPALADDSGLEIEALDGAPGVHTADWAETQSGRDFQRAMERAWSALKAEQAPEPWTARFRCTLVLAWPDGADDVFEDAVEGRCIWPPRGKQGHGFDPMFQPDGHDVTFGEMDQARKNRISHRGRALAKLVAAHFA